jgi:hypothetical protein
MIVFALIYFISVNIRKKVLSRNTETSRIDIDVDKRGIGFSEEEGKKDHPPIKTSDPFMRKNITLLGFIFIFTVLLVLLALAVFYYSWNIGINSGLYMIGAVFFVFVVLLIFISRSGTINK